MKSRIEILADVTKLSVVSIQYGMKRNPDGIFVKSLEAMKIAMRQAWIAGFNDSSFSHYYGFLQQSDEGFEDWFNKLEGGKK